MTTRWVFAVENRATAVDPIEVRYRLVQLDENDHVLQTDAVLLGGQHGLWARVQEAIDNPVFELTEAVTRKVKIL